MILCSCANLLNAHYDQTITHTGTKRRKVIGDHIVSVPTYTSIALAHECVRSNVIVKSQVGMVLIVVSKQKMETELLHAFEE